MKLYHILLPLAATSLLLTSCYDEKMDWHTPEGQGAIVSSEIPLELAEKIANYDYIKNYAAQYMPETKIGLGISADIYTDIEGSKNYNEAYAEVANANFQMFTPGNAMKHQAVVTASGALNLSTVTPFIEQANAAGIEVFGHNFIWHTQQQQNYLATLIAPDIDTYSDDPIATLLVNGNFESGKISPWMGWGGGSDRTVEAGKGYNGSAGLVVTVPTDNTYHYDVQNVQDLAAPLEIGKTYTLRFKARCETEKGTALIHVAVQQPSAPYPEEGSNDLKITSEWKTYEREFTVEDHNTLTRLCINTGLVAGTYYFDEVELGEKKAEEDPDEGRTNLLANGTFDEDMNDWGQWNGGADNPVSWNADEGKFAKGCMQVVNTLTEPTSQWKVQIHADLTENIAEGTTFYISYYIKCAEGTGSVRFSTTGNAHYQGDQTVTSGWQRIEWTGTAGGTINGICIDIAAVPNTYYIDNIVVSTDPFAATARQNSIHRAVYTSVTFRTAEEKREALLGAMKEWIDGMAVACPTVKQWDVINEPISDSNHKWRGVKDEDGSVTFGMDGDSEPTETVDDGLTLNWVNETGNGHFYWGYYIGKDYAPKAFEYARAAIGSDAKLYVNEYGLETSPGKTAALIDFVNYIDQNGGQVDGIGTQMHITLSGTNNDAANNAEKVAELKEKVDAMFKTLAATGKLVRVSELDISFGTSNGEEVSPSAAQYEAQSDAYRAVMDSYKENVPAAQRGGFVIWTLSDNKKEHEYWLKGDKPNLFDKNYARKHAYKGLCDGIAGYDISTDFSGDQWNVK
ncbi:MAG: endo-1,4-beta-xylanase [Prevotella sp.]|nr:endo-1,4-beta-xylanase [Prevotella sp.]